MNIIDDYVTVSQTLSPNEFNNDEVFDIVFEHMAHDIVEAVRTRKMELPNKDCVFVLICEIYKLEDYKKVRLMTSKGKSQSALKELIKKYEDMRKKVNSTELRRKYGPFATNDSLLIIDEFIKDLKEVNESVVHKPKQSCNGSLVDSGSY